MTPRLLQAFADQSWSYENFSPNGRLHIVCPQCRAVVVLFENVEPIDKTKIARLRRSDLKQAIAILTEVSGCDLRQAKANILHISGTPTRAATNAIILFHEAACFVVNVCPSTWIGDWASSNLPHYYRASQHKQPPRFKSEAIVYLKLGHTKDFSRTLR